MKLRSLTTGCTGVLLLVIVLASGCHRRDPYIDAYLEIVSAEKRDLEDQIYALEDELTATRQQLEAARTRLPTIRGTTPRPAPSRTTPAPGPPIDDEELMPPMIDPGEPLEPKIEIPRAGTASPGGRQTGAKPVVNKPVTRTMSTSPEPIPDPNTSVPGDDDIVPPLVEEDLPAPQRKSQPSFRQPAIDAEEIDPQVSRLFINPFHTTGVDFDQQPGDDGLKIVFEPRNEAGQFVSQAGPVSVVVLDPSRSGEAARVARWDLSKQEVAEGILAARPAPGVRLELPWPGQRPESGKLKLFLRYTAQDGRLVEASSDVFIAQPGQISERWTPSRR